MFKLDLYLVEGVLSVNVFGVDVIIYNIIFNIKCLVYKLSYIGFLFKKNKIATYTGYGSFLNQNQTKIQFSPQN